MSRRLAVLKAALVIALPLLSSTGHAIDLIGSYHAALRYDPTTLAAGEAALAGRELAIQGDALLLPQVQLSASYSYVRDKSTTSLPGNLTETIKSDSSGNVHQMAVEFKQPLYDAKAAADKKQLYQRTELSEISYRNARQDLVQRVAEAYFQVLLAQENVRVVQAEKAAVALQLERAQARFDVGRGRITEVQETQARYDTVLTKEVSAFSTLELRQAQYLELTGAPPRGLAELRPGFVPIPPQPDNLQAWQLKGNDRNTRVLSKQSELAIARAEIDKHKLSGRPTLDLVGSYTLQGAHGGLSPTIAADNSRTTVVGVQLTIPLYAGGALNSRERESIARRREAEHDLTAAQRDARLQVQDAFLSVKTGVSRIGALEQSLLSARTALEATTLGRDVGTRTDLDVLDAQQRMFGAELDLAQARNDYLVGRIRLASAAGELEERDLLALNAYLAR